MTANVMSACNWNTLSTFSKPSKPYSPRSTGISPSFLVGHHLLKGQNKTQNLYFKQFIVFAKTEGSAKSSQSEEKIPSWALPDSEEPPPWAREEGGQSASPTLVIPFAVYLLSSAITAIAAVGSMFEFVNQKPIFGVIQPDSIIYAPILGFFAITGIPASAFLWFKSVEAANKEAEEQDRRDGFL